MIRTDFSDDVAWRTVKAAVSAEDYSGSGYEPNLAFVERRDLASMEAEALVAEIPTQYPSDYEQPFLIIVDALAMSSPEHPVLLVDLNEEDTSPPFRALPREIAAIEANLSLANMDFFEFGDSVDSNGVFRGFN
ncbi:MAG: hypothetical protein INR66_25190 [Gordonia polyisoprenivorans]|nr:hypothetical protein [Gordonia polyisoprenivorans]